jgi:hypothetical protein
MEAMLPSLVTKIAPADAKGTATGIYSSAQFLGIFVGGAGGGLAFASAGVTGVFSFAVILALLWLAIAIMMRRPGLYASYLVHLTTVDRQAIGALEGKLKAAPGVIEAVIAPDESVAYLKIDRARFDANIIAQIVNVDTSETQTAKSPGAKTASKKAASKKAASKKAASKKAVASKKVARPAKKRTPSK